MTSLLRRIEQLVHTVTVVCKEQLRPYEQNLAIEDDDPAVVSVVAMHDRHTDIAYNAVNRSVGQNDGHLLPGMEVCIRFQDLGASA
jgi:hypothetical protein